VVAAAGAVCAPALEAWRDALGQDQLFADAVGDDRVLHRARDAVLAWLRAPSDDALASVAELTPSLTAFVERVEFLCEEISGDGRLHSRASELAWCVCLAARSVTWTDAAADAASPDDALERAARVAAGPAYEAAEAVGIYATHSPGDRARVVSWIAELLGIPSARSTPPR